MQTVEVNKVKKLYENGAVLALDDVSLSIKEGELFGLIGPDGSGKTSLFRVLTTLLLPDGGSASVCGLDVVKDFKKIRHIVGYMPGRFSLYQDLSVEENLNFFATVFNTTVEKNYHLIKDIYIQLEPFKKRDAGKLSGGMKQKLALCCALIHEPKVLFLDEPTTGVDPVSRKEFWEMLRKLKERGITILVSTPYMDEAVLCDRIALIQKGKIMEMNTLDKILAQHQSPLYAIKGENMYQLLQDIRSFSGTASCLAFGDQHHLSFVDNHDLQQELISYLQQRGHQKFDLLPIQPGIEDIFIQLMNEQN
jgi:ABC-2 type transport system ATP-binding protein